MDPLTLLLLGGLGGGLLGGIGSALGGNSWNGQYTNLNKDYAKNPTYQWMMGSGGLGDVSSAGMNSMLAKAGSYDPTAFFKDFMSATPSLSSLISGPTGSVKSAMEDNLDAFVKKATSEAGSSLSGMGTLYSGALGDIIGKNIGTQVAQSNVDLSSLYANLFGNMSNTLMGNLASGRQAQMSGNLQGAGIYGNLLNSILGTSADMSAPMYTYQPGIMDAIMQGAGLGMQGGSGIGMLGQGNKALFA